MLLSYVNYITEMLVPTQNLAQFKKKKVFQVTGKIDRKVKPLIRRIQAFLL